VIGCGTTAGRLWTTLPTVQISLPSNFPLFVTLKEHLPGKRLATNADVKQVVTSSLQTFDTDYFYVGMATMVLQCDRCLNVNDDYVEV
jgi:hypothetical protein